MNEAPKENEIASWFSQALQPHETMLRAWLVRRFPFVGDTDDIIQEAYQRVLQASRRTAIASPKAFLFATARNLALGRLRHRKVENTIPLGEIDAGGILDESVDVPDAVAHGQELALLKQAMQSLPPRCREVLTLRKIYGLSQKQVAAELGISENTVERQSMIGFHRVVKFFRNAGVDTRPRHD